MDEWPDVLKIYLLFGSHLDGVARLVLNSAGFSSDHLNN